MFLHNSEGTSLSAEVPPFVPRKEWMDGVHHSASPLPRYVTTCYPFVQEQQDRRHHVSSQPLQSLQVNPVTQWPRQPVYHSAYIAPNISGNVPDSMHANVGYGPPPQVLLTQNVHKSSRSNDSQRTDGRSNARKVMKRNVGIQKEVNMHGPDDDDDEVPVMVDSSQQTDFPDNIASKSLSNKPSPLKKMARNRHPKTVMDESPESSSDHADFDSDSGYNRYVCSPKRKPNHKKSGGTSTSGLLSNSEQASSSMQPVLYMPPPCMPPSMLYRGPPPTPPQFHPGVVIPHSSASVSTGHVLGYSSSDGSVIMTPPPSRASVMDHPVSSSQPPASFPIPTASLNPHNTVQLPNGWFWDGTNYLPPNYATSAPQQLNYYRRGNDRRPNTSPNRRRSGQMGKYGPNFPAERNQNRPEKWQDRKKLNNAKLVPNKQQSSHQGATVKSMQQVTHPGSASSTSIFLEDTQEFPGLGGFTYVPVQNPSSRLSYSQALIRSPREKQQAAAVTDQPTTSKPIKSPEELTNERAQKSRKRWKKTERASKAADEEYAEISQEQENIKKTLKKTASNRNRNKTNMLDLGEIFARLETKPSSAAGKKVVQIGAGIAPTTSQAPKPTARPKQILNMPANPLDSTAPSVKRGKERETPKVKKPSALKKVILKEREEKKEQRLQQLSTMTLPDHDIPPYPTAMLNPVADTTEESVSSAGSKLTQLTIDDVPPNVPQIHSRRYREYCCQILDKKIDETCTIILQKLVQFQDRLYQKDPIKAKMRRRLVMGLREVTKHLKLKKLKCVIISPNLEKIQSKGGLDDALQQILTMCEEQKVAYIFALGRKAMGRAVSKLVPVSIVGIFDYSGVEEHYKELVELVVDAQSKYKEMVSIYQQEVVEANTPSVPVPAPSSKRFAHMTHSRNPSAASCISFASFISEPISEMNEESNWRVLMDAGDESTLSPPREAEGSSDGEETCGDLEPSPAKPTDADSISRKDSESTIVDCKAFQELAEVSVEKEADKVSSERNSSACAAEKNISSTSQNFNKSSNSSSSIATGQNSTNLDEVSRAVETHSKTPGQEEGSSLNIATLETSGSPTSVQDRVTMWLEDTQCSIQGIEEDDDDADDEDDEDLYHDALGDAQSPQDEEKYDVNGDKT